VTPVCQREEGATPVKWLFPILSSGSANRRRWQFKLRSLDKTSEGRGVFPLKAEIEFNLTLVGVGSLWGVTSAEAGNYSSGVIEFLSYRYRITVYG